VTDHTVLLLTYSHLRSRGWSPSLIASFFPKSGTRHFYALPAVLQAEQTDTFRRAPRALSAGELAYLRAEIEIDTSLSLAELRAAARRRWRDRHRAAPPPTARVHVNRLAVNHARHRLSNLHSFYGKVRPFACQVARNMILAEIAEAWPELAAEAYGQMSLSEAIGEIAATESPQASDST